MRRHPLTACALALSAFSSTIPAAPGEGTPHAPNASCEAADAKCGYWFYKEPPSENDAEKQTALQPPPAEAALLQLKPAEFQKLLDDYLGQALTSMQPEHVKWYYELQDFARRRSRAFMNVSQLVMLQNPDLNMNTAYPASPPGINARVAERQTDLDARLALEREGAALVLLSRASCGMCEAQRGTLKYFQQKHGWEVREFDLGEHPEIATRFATNFTPTTIVIFRGSADWMPVAVGVETVPKIEEGVYNALRMLHGETTPQQFGTPQFQDGGILDPQRSVP